jgi:hypothetical protein
MRAALTARGAWCSFTEGMTDGERERALNRCRRELVRRHPYEREVALDSWSDSGSQKQRRCPRCGALLKAWTMSYFNTEEICMACSADEKLAPGFPAARAAEEAAVRAGNLNFPGLGLSAIDDAFLAERRRKRQGGPDP